MTERCARVTKQFLRYMETQWIKTAGLDNGDVLSRQMKLPTRFHDEILIAVYGELIPSCPPPLRLRRLL